MSAETTLESRDTLEAVIAHLVSKRRDPVAMKKAREDMDRMREETRQRVGTVEAAVNLIREVRE